MKTISGLVTVAFLSLAVLAGCISGDDGVSKEKSSSAAPSSSAVPTTSPTPTPSTAPATSPSPSPSMPPSPSPTPPTAAGATAVHFSGTVLQAGLASVEHLFDVAADTKQITVYLTWDDGVTGNTPFVSDLDAYLIDGTATEVVAAETSANFEYFKFNDTTKIPPGKWKVKVTPFIVPADTAYSLDVLVWAAKPTQVFLTNTLAGVNLGAGADEITGNDPRAQAIPSGTTLVAARLTWTDAAGSASTAQARIGNDFDLYVFQGTVEQMRGGNGGAYEFAYKVHSEAKPLVGGDWSFEVVPFATTPVAKYTLTIEYV